MSDVQQFSQGTGSRFTPPPNPPMLAPITRSWLFEIVKTATSEIMQSFTLVLPPQRLQIKEKQRVKITKTFGNAIVDDYGPDNLEITISGISGTAHVFPTYRTQVGGTSTLGQFPSLNESASAYGGQAGYDGRNAFFVFRDTIMRYKDIYKDNFEKFEMRVYDLYDEQSYKCALLEFALDRNSQDPLRYPFTISLFVYYRTDSPKFGVDKVRKQVITTYSDPVRTAAQAENQINWFQNVYRGLTNILNQVSLAQTQLNLLLARLNTNIQRAGRVLQTPLILSKEYFETVFEISEVLYNAYGTGAITLLKYISAVETWELQVRQAAQIFNFSVTQGAQQTRTERIEFANGLDVDADTGEVTPLSSDQRYTYSGVTPYTVKAGDTLQRIALTQLGDSILWPFVASVNGFESNDDLVIGDEIYIPAELNVEGVTKDTFIITENPVRDPYGTDIRISEDGDLLIQENGDFALISGINNVIQSVDLKMGTTVGSMIKQSGYGLTAVPGVPAVDLSVSYMRMAFRTALLQDPRIGDVKDVRVQFQQDALYIRGNIQLVAQENYIPVSLLV